jgi:cyanophycin synthetase
VIFFAHESKSAVIEEHLQQGERAVFVSDGNLVLATGNEQVILTRLSAIPLLNGELDNPAGKSKVGHVLAAIAAAWALDISPALMQAGIEAFEVKR